MYIWSFGLIHFAIWRNTFYNLDKYILQFEQIHFAIWTNTFFQFGQIHFTTNILRQTRVQHYDRDQRLLPHLGHPHNLPHDLLPVQSANHLKVGFLFISFFIKMLSHEKFPHFNIVEKHLIFLICMFMFSSSPGMLTYI